MDKSPLVTTRNVNPMDGSSSLQLEKVLRFGAGARERVVPVLQQLSTSYYPKLELCQRTLESRILHGSRGRV